MCKACQCSKVGQYTKKPLEEFHHTDHCFHTIHLDLVGPLPADNGYKYLFTCMDRFSRWLEAFPLQNAMARDVTDKFCSGWMVWYSCQAGPRKWCAVQVHGENP